MVVHKRRVPGERKWLIKILNTPSESKLRGLPDLIQQRTRNTLEKLQFLK